MRGLLRAAVFTFVLAGIVLIRYGWEPASAAVQPQADRKAAPQFTLHDASGKEAKLSDYKGKAVLLNFWATWCGPCKLEIPWFIEFQRKYRDQGLAVLGVSMDDDGWKVITPYVQKVGMNYTVLLGNEDIAKLYGGVEGLPTTFLIDRTGKIAAMHTGIVSKNAYEGEILELLKK